MTYLYTILIVRVWIPGTLIICMTIENANGWPAA